MNTTGNPTTELADGLRSAFAEAALRAPLLAPLISLILARLDTVLRQLEAIFASWQAGTLPAPRPAAVCSPASAPTPSATDNSVPVLPLRRHAPTPVAGAWRRPAPLSPQRVEPAAPAATAIARCRAAPYRPPNAGRRAKPRRLPITARHAPARAPPAAPRHFSARILTGGNRA